MIPGLLDSKIKTMNGRELAIELMNVVRHRDDEFTLEIGGASIGCTVYSGDPYALKRAFAHVIDSIREADRT